jgi:hypothetical protein
MQKFAEDDRIEQMKQSQRRMKQLEHRRAVDALVAERKRLLQENELEQKKQEELEAEIAKYKAAVIEQERQRLLREHASKLAGFLPKVPQSNTRVYCEIKKTWTYLMKNSRESFKFRNKVLYYTLTTNSSLSKREASSFLFHQSWVRSWIVFQFHYL